MGDVGDGEKRRFSKRAADGQRIKTKGLRRLQEIFWRQDSLYERKVIGDDEDEDNGEGGNSEVPASALIEVVKEEGECGDERMCHTCGRPRRRRRRYTKRMEDAIKESETAAARRRKPDGNPRGKPKLNFGQRMKLHRIHSSPHVYIIDDFLTETELQHLDQAIATAERKGQFKQSFVDSTEGRFRQGKRPDSGDQNGESPAVPQRTSTFIHFPKLADSKVASIERRASELLGLPHHSIEPLQLVRYTEGQYFLDHHDMGVVYEDGTVELPPRTPFSAPRRMVTLLVYLNDLPDRECGGSTRFPRLQSAAPARAEQESHSPSPSSRYCTCDPTTTSTPSVRRSADSCTPALEVFPKRGRALLWCNIDRDGNPDARLIHSGQPLKSQFKSNKIEEDEDLVIIPLPPASYSGVSAKCQNVEFAVSTTTLLGVGSKCLEVEFPKEFPSKLPTEKHSSARTKWEKSTRDDHSDDMSTTTEESSAMGDAKDDLLVSSRSDAGGSARPTKGAVLPCDGCETNWGPLEDEEVVVAAILEEESDDVEPGSQTSQKKRRTSEFSDASNETKSVVKYVMNIWACEE